MSSCPLLAGLLAGLLPTAWCTQPSIIKGLSTCWSPHLPSKLERDLPPQGEAVGVAPPSKPSEAAHARSELCTAAGIGQGAFGMKWLMPSQWSMG